MVIGERPLKAARFSLRGGDGAPSGWASLWECRAAQGRQARPEEAQGASWGAAKAGTLPMLYAQQVDAQRDGDDDHTAAHVLLVLVAGHPVVRTGVESDLG